jgi:hypothetical protein
MNIRGFFRRAGLLAAVVAASFWIVPGAFARTHVSVGVGISVPGVSVGVANCWRCGYWAPPPPPVYYAPVYSPPVYYTVPAPVYYTPRPVYYGYGYYVPRHHHRYYPRGWHHSRGRYHHHHGH